MSENTLLYYYLQPPKHNNWHAWIESFRFWDEDDYEYQILSILSITHPWTSVILAEKCDSSCHSTTSFGEDVEGTSYQM